MFGLFTLPAPLTTANPADINGNRQQGGSPARVFVMGAACRINLLSPCTTAPIARSCFIAFRAATCGWAAVRCDCMRGYGSAAQCWSPCLATVCYRKAARGWRMLKPLLVSYDPRVTRNAFTGADYWRRLGVFPTSVVAAGRRCLVGPCFITTAFGQTSVDAYHLQIIYWRQRSLAMRPHHRTGVRIAIPAQAQHLNFTAISTVDELNQALARAKANTLCWISTPTGA